MSNEPEQKADAQQQQAHVDGQDQQAKQPDELTDANLEQVSGGARKARPYVPPPAPVAPLV